MPGPHLSGKPRPHLCVPPAYMEQMPATPYLPTLCRQHTNRRPGLARHPTLGFLSAI